MCSSEFCEISKNTFFTEHFWATVSTKSNFLLRLESASGIFFELSWNFQRNFLKKHLRVISYRSLKIFFGTTSEKEMNAVFCLVIILSRMGPDIPVYRFKVLIVSKWF